MHPPVGDSIVFLSRLCCVPRSTSSGSLYTQSPHGPGVTATSSSTAPQVPARVENADAEAAKPNGDAVAAPLAHTASETATLKQRFEALGGPSIGASDPQVAIMPT